VRRVLVPITNLWWPDEWAWCAQTKVDFMSTYLGGARVHRRTHSPTRTWKQ
jgi:hypothetical protein